eukprot:15063249-Alexandrium_andersonii.AAC.1
MTTGAIFLMDLPSGRSSAGVISPRLGVRGAEWWRSPSPVVRAASRQTAGGALPRNVPLVHASPFASWGQCFMALNRPQSGTCAACSGVHTRP